MNRFKSHSKRFMWFIALLLPIFMVGCADKKGGATITTLRSIVVTPATASIPVSGTQQYTATAIYSNGSSRNVTATSSWASGTPGVATISSSTGVAVGLATGTSLITASFDGKTSQPATLTVNAATSVSFTVTPATTTIPVSGTRKYQALETFSNGSTFDRTALSNWTAPDLVGVGVATIANSGANIGVATGTAVGQALITARYNGRTATANLTVNAATSVSLTVTPATTTIPITGTRKYLALETFTDGSTFDRTALSNWTAPDLVGVGVATIANSGVDIGVATGVTVGQARITANYNGKTATAILTVNAATSVSFTVTPATTTIPITGTRKYLALETFSDGSTFDRTALSNWTAPDLLGVNVATISNSGLTIGTATGVSAGQSTITATYNSKTATAILTVTAAASTGFTVTPATTTIPITGTRQYMALETFSDGSTADRTQLSVWTAPDLLGVNVATISNIGLTIGTATGVSAGQATITAKYNGMTATAILTVTAVVPGPGPGAAGAVDLKSAAPFGLIAYNAITNAAGLNSHIYGDVALTQPGPGGTIASVTGPGTNDFGFPTLLKSSIVTDSAGVTPGMITAANNGAPANIAALPQLLVDLGLVYNDLFNRAAPLTQITNPLSASGISGGTFNAPANDLTGYILSPGIYTATGTYGLSNLAGPLVLDAGGNPNAVFIIRSTNVGPSGFTSTTGSVVLQNGAQAKNVFWVVDNLTVGAGTFFQGTVVAGHAITLLAHANVEGRMLAGALGLVSGALTLTDTNVITVPK